MVLLLLLGFQRWSLVGSAWHNASFFFAACISMNVVLVALFCVRAYEGE